MHILAVMSGKGGVGKSFVATGLAAALQRRGGHVAVLDADITGALVPHLLGVPRGAFADGDGRLIPGVSADGIRVVSMSLMASADDKAVVWRGPLISNAINELFTQTAWGDSEYLVVDMPPGTSDAALTVLEQLRPEGVMIVTTPQDMVTRIAHRSHDMVRAMGGNVVGLVMNMAYVVCPDCGRRIEAFGPVRAASESGLDVLLTLPLVPEWATLADTGHVAEIAPAEFDALAEAVLARMGSNQETSETSSADGAPASSLSEAGGPAA
jgi:Mrp family chromosome partitioning ATPase